MTSSDEFEDDPFDYKPLKRRKLLPSQNKSQFFKKPTKKSQKSVTNTPGNSKLANKCNKPVNNTPNPVIPKRKSLNQILENSIKDHNNEIVKPSVTESPSFCPMCQMPLDLLEGVITPAIHLNQCEKPDVSVACPHGINCRSRVKRHYVLYGHEELARHRSLGFHDQTTAKLWFESDSSSSVAPSLNAPSSRPAPPLNAKSLEIQSSRPALSLNAPSSRPAPSLNAPSLNAPSSRPAPPIGCSTPINAQSYISPIKVTRRYSHSQQQNNKNVETREISSIPVIFSQNDRTFDPELDLVINQALENINQENGVVEEGGTAENVIEGHSEIAGPSRAVINGRNLEADQSESPIKVTATKDSQELELSVEIQPNIECTRLRVKVPLRKNASGQELPLEVQTNYTNRTNPKKLTKMSQIFETTPTKKSEESSIDSNDFGVINLSKAKEQGKQWKELFGRAKKKADVSPPSNSNEEQKSHYETKRKCPWYKKITDTTISVDAFNFGEISGVNHYFLSHYHYDHYIGLNKRWNKKIYCSATTGRLVTKFLGLSKDLVVEVSTEEARVVGGVEVTCVDANHCPGSLMFIFRLTSGVTILHTGDFRASPEMESEAVFWNGKIDRIYLDTTYCRPEYNFPSQADVVEASVALVTEHLEANPNTLVLVGAYTIGKERIFKAIAEALDSKLWAENRRLSTWQCLGDSDILDRVVKDKTKARVHVVPMKDLNYGALAKLHKDLGDTFDNVLGVKPTGWTHQKGATQENSLSSIKIKTKGKLGLLEVPYSEHSCYGDLKRFIMFLRFKNAKDIIPTVNIREISQMREMFKQWIDERKNLGPDSQ